MGVRGLTNYIAQNAELYLKPYELHDTDLVIDGDNLACNLYKDVSECNSAFGGDYDEYYRTVVNFFQVLSQCNIRPFVLLDGGYESKKLKTVEQRLRSKIGAIKHINPLSSRPLFPLMMREVFVDAARDCNVRIMRCIFEADDELAVLSRKLNCPLLSYDSDFYIHNVKYIPMITLTMRVLTKSTMEQTSKESLRYCEAKHLMKKNKNQKNCLKSNDSENSTKKSKTVNYLDCCIYKIENLISAGSLQRDKLPIFAALLGNDYITRSAFKDFYSQMGFKGINKKMSLQQRRIRAILRWLRHESKESAIEKILGRMKKQERDRLLAHFQSATDGYIKEQCLSFEFFGLDENDYRRYESDPEEGEIEFEEVDDDDEGEEESENDEVDGEEEVESEAISEELEEIENNENVSDEEPEILNDESNKQEIVPEHDFKEWFLRRIHSGDLPRFFVDLVHLKLYINNPQIQNFLFDDANDIALEILRYIFTLVNHPESPNLRYLTREIHKTNVHNKTLYPFILETDFEPNIINLEAFKVIFRGLDSYNEIFEAIKFVPEDLQLYFLTIYYWSIKTRAINLHLYSLVICLVVLNTIDSKVEPIRDEKKFNKKFGKIIKKARSAKIKDDSLNLKEQEKAKKIQELLNNLNPCEKIKFVSKTECLLVQESLLKHFHMNEDFRKRHNDFSSRILHGFSEFQSVLFHLYSLNALLNFPYKNIKISQIYCGLFLYNIFISLRNRSDIDYYVEKHIFHDSSIMFEYYKYLIDWCKKYLNIIRDGKDVKLNSKKTKKKAKPAENASRERHEDNKINLKTDTSDEDINNKFSALLRIS